MDFRPPEQIPLLAAATFVTAILVLAVQLITPSPVMVSLAENGTQTKSVGQYFTYTDVAVAVVASLFCGASGTYLVLYNRAHQLVGRTKQRDTRLPPTASDYVESSGGRVDVNSDGREPSDERWEEIVDTLKNNEETVYTVLMEAGGEIPQRKIVEKTDLSKATVSRTLDKLENRGLVERKRSGMGNTIHLRTPRNPLKRA